MEELLAYAILMYEEIISKEIYTSRLDELFLENPTDKILLELECDSNIQNAIIFIRTNVDYNNLDAAKFGKVLMNLLKEYYSKCEDIKTFADKMYSLWESFPGNIQDIEPFCTLSYADDPLSWGDEERTRELYEKALRYYDSEKQSSEKL